MSLNANRRFVRNTWRTTQKSFHLLGFDVRYLNSQPHIVVALSAFLFLLDSVQHFPCFAWHCFGAKINLHAHNPFFISD